MPTPKSKLSRFILSLPATLTGSQVVDRAKAKGMKTSRANVSRVRGLFGAKAVKTSPTKPSATSKPASPTSKPNPPSKSDFIRQQLATLSAAEVVAKAKAQGIKFTSQLVYNVRGRSTAKVGAAKKTSTVMKSTAPKSPVAVSKADFVRARAHLSPKEIVEDAKAEGVKFDASYVYRVRGYDKAARKPMRVVTKPPTSVSATTAAVNGALASVASPATASSSAEDLLRAVAAELGLGRAVEILAGERARVRAVIGG
jgi:hypothetical protein